MGIGDVFQDIFANDEVETLILKGERHEVLAAYATIDGTEPDLIPVLRNGDPRPVAQGLCDGAGGLGTQGVEAAEPVEAVSKAGVVASADDFEEDFRDISAAFAGTAVGADSFAQDRVFVVEEKWRGRGTAKAAGLAEYGKAGPPCSQGAPDTADSSHQGWGRWSLWEGLHGLQFSFVWP